MALRSLWLTCPQASAPQPVVPAAHGLFLQFQKHLGTILDFCPPRCCRPPCTHLVWSSTSASSLAARPPFSTAATTESTWSRLVLTPLGTICGKLDAVRPQANVLPMASCSVAPLLTFSCVKHTGLTGQPSAVPTPPQNKAPGSGGLTVTLHSF